MTPNYLCTFGEVVVVLDLNADGMLDRMEKGTESLRLYQRLYREVLSRGLKEKRVVKKDGMYIVVV